MNPKTKVIFRMFRGEVLALFPQDAGTNNPGTCSCYAHNGQHGSASLALCHEGRLATPAEYAPLARELRNYGPPEAHYNLDIRKRATRKDYEMRKAQISR